MNPSDLEKYRRHGKKNAGLITYIRIHNTDTSYSAIQNLRKSGYDVDALVNDLVAATFIKK